MIPVRAFWIVLGATLRYSERDRMVWMENGKTTPKVSGGRPRQAAGLATALVAGGMTDSIRVLI